MVDRKSTRLNSSHLVISYAVFCLKKKKKTTQHVTTHYNLRLEHNCDAPRCGELKSAMCTRIAVELFRCLILSLYFFFFFNDPAPTEISPLPLHDALPI